MTLDSRLSSILHVLLHMAALDRPTTSETLARYLGTNPVVVRRTMASLRKAGLVRSEKGHGGGWSIQCDLAATTVGDVYDALGAPPVFALGHRNAEPQCLVEQAVNASLDDALREAEALLLERLAEVSLADLAREFRRRWALAFPHETDPHAHES